MKLTLGQVQTALGLSRETYRHWKQVLLPLSLRKGHGACFTHGDLFAVAVIQALTSQFGVSVGKLDPVARALFETCGQQSWAKFERATALIHPDDWSLSFVADGQPLPTKRAAIVIPCGPIIADLRRALMIEQLEDAQTSFRFPLASVAPGRGRQPQ